MKITAAMVAGLALVAPAKAAELNDADRAFIAVFVTSISVMNVCGGYEPVPRAMWTIADRMGVSDPDAIFGASGEALKMWTDEDYDRSQLIPEVTRFVNDSVNGLAKVIKQMGDRNYCREFGPRMVALRAIRKTGR